MSPNLFYGASVCENEKKLDSVFFRRILKAALRVRLGKEVTLTGVRLV